MIYIGSIFKENEMDYLMEIQAGCGGEDSKLFIRDLYNMYDKCMTRRGTAHNIVAESPSRISFVAYNASYL
jgi:protein subunit release factor A